MIAALVSPVAVPLAGIAIGAVRTGMVVDFLREIHTAMIFASLAAGQYDSIPFRVVRIHQTKQRYQAR